VKRVTDPELLRQLEEGASTSLNLVTDPALLAQLEVKPAERSFSQNLMRHAGLAARAAGPVGAGALAGGAVGSVIPGVGTAAGASAGAASIGLAQLADRLLGTQYLDRLMTFMGLPEAENETERVFQDVTGGMTGGATSVKLGETMAKAGTPLVRKIGEILTTRPGLQITAGATGGGAAGTVREAGGGPVAQFAAGVLGSAIPAAPSLLAEATRRAVRSGELGTLRSGELGHQQMARNVESFERAGAGTPTVGQATEERMPRAIESILAKTPGAAGRMAAKAEAQAAGLGTKVEEMASRLTPRAGAAPAGRQIASGIDDFVKGFRAKSTELYDKVDRFIAPDTKVPAANTLAKLGELTKPIPGATKTSKLIQTPKLAAVEAALTADVGATPARPILSKLLGSDGKPIVTGEMLAQPGGLPYQAMKELRSAVGKRIETPSLVDDVPTGQWKQLYGALTRDMVAAARAAGPKAEAAMVRANNHYQSGLKRIEEVLQPVLAKGDPEDIFRATIAGTKEGATTLQGVMKGLPTESRKVVTATVLKRLGHALPGKQDELGEVFSAETFLTNWNRLHPDAKRTLFAPMPEGMRADLDRIAQVAANLREGAKVFPNPSGTAQAAASYTTAGGFALALLTGQFVPAAWIAGGVGVANASGRLMTNPKFVHWLAKATREPVEQLPAQLNNLFQQSLYMSGDERREVRDFIKQTREAAGTPRRERTQ
jgi:hypothetical protein